MIKNYSTKISPTKTAGEIAEMLAGAGALRIHHEYAGGHIVSLTFSIMVNGQELFYRLPSRPNGVLETLRRDGAPKSLLTLEHARAVAWRITKDWIDAQLAIIDAGSADLSEVFLPYMLDRQGRTFYEVLLSGELPLALGTGEETKS